MAGEHFHVVSERPEFLTDAAQQQIVIAAGQIRAADAAGKEHVAAE